MEALGPFVLHSLLWWLWWCLAVSLTLAGPQPPWGKPGCGRHSSWIWPGHGDHPLPSGWWSAFSIPLVCSRSQGVGNWVWLFFFDILFTDVLYYLGNEYRNRRKTGLRIPWATVRCLAQALCKQTRSIFLSGSRESLWCSSPQVPLEVGPGADKRRWPQWPCLPPPSLSDALWDGAGEEGMLLEGKRREGQRREVVEGEEIGVIWDRLAYLVIVPRAKPFHSWEFRGLDGFSSPPLSPLT